MKAFLPLKIDLHVHTNYSSDALTSLDELVVYAKRRGLNGVAVTDHDTVKGALKLLENKPNGLTVIAGIEVSTEKGHVLGLGVKTSIPSGLTIEETVEKIHRAGGIAVAAHPSAMFKSGIGLDERIPSMGFDAIEVVNASVVPFFLFTMLNRRLAQHTGLPQTAGSDSHIPETIGLAYTEIEMEESEPSSETILEAIKKSKTTPFGKSVPWTLRFRKIFGQKRKKDVT